MGEPQTSTVDFTLEKMKIHERLTAVEVNQNHMGSKIDEIHKALMGSNGNCGLIKSVDRLEQTVKTWKDSIKAVWVAIIGVAVKTFWGLFDK